MIVTKDQIEAWLKRHGIQTEHLLNEPMRMVVNTSTGNVSVQVPIAVWDEENDRPLIDRQAREIVTDLRTVPLDIGVELGL